MSGWEVSGTATAEGIMPVEVSSVGSQTPIRIGFGFWVEEGVLEGRAVRTGIILWRITVLKLWFLNIAIPSVI